MQYIEKIKEVESTETPANVTQNSWKLFSKLRFGQNLKQRRLQKEMAKFEVEICALCEKVLFYQ